MGRKTGKIRPVLIIQNDIGNTYSQTTIVAVITEYSDKKASYPICVPIPKFENLKKDSIANLSQIRTIDKKRLAMPKIATLPADLVEKVDEALKHSLALYPA
jgi:mRNA interferase MazF